MILVFDVGNTELTIGLFSESELRGHWRVMTDVPRTSDEFGVLLHTLLQTSGFDAGAVRSVAIGSVVPRVTEPLSDACIRYFTVGQPLIVDARADLPITLDVDEPLTVGADRLINTLAASRIFARDAIVVDLGTATTYDCITADGTFLGGVIQPGVRTSGANLISKASQLTATELVAPAKTIGTNTADCIRAGVMFGAADAIDGLIRRIKREWPTASVPLVIATGGLATTFRSLCGEIDDVDPGLTLKGLQIAHELLG